ncbi:MAG: hypothetical protein COA78_20815 [Blastopirellula sp.]|nr:MAG: hypothetical protein COA78_20815 [Blastopirellula sp.]
MNSAELWNFLGYGYLLTIAIEFPILLIGLSPRHSLAKRCMAAVWLTACTYPIVVLVLPILIWNTWGYMAYLVVAETFAPLAECLLFRLIDTDQGPNLLGSRIRDAVTIVIANLASFLLGAWILNQ